MALKGRFWSDAPFVGPSNTRSTYTLGITRAKYRVGSTFPSGPVGSLNSLGILSLKAVMAASNIWNSAVSRGSMPTAPQSNFVLKRPLKVFTRPRSTVDLTYKLNESVVPCG